MPSSIIETGVAFPRFEYDQETVKGHLIRWLESFGEQGRRYLATLDTNLVERRAFVEPLEVILAPRSFGAKNDAYVRAAIDLGERAVVNCLEKARIGPGAIDRFISTSCTGFMIPSLDAVLAHRLGMKQRLSRLPITEHGCAAGAVALAEACTHLRAYPDHRVLVLSVELASLTFLRDDLSPENIIASGLFGDGAAAVVLTTESRAGRPEIVTVESQLFPGSADLMGFKLTNAGLKLILSRDIPDAIHEHAVPALHDFLARNGLTPAGVRHWLLHPGGRKIIECFERALELGQNGLARSRAILRQRGNLSSTTVLCMLDDLFADGGAKPGDVGVLVAFGPGFGAEMLLLRWP